MKMVTNRENLFIGTKDENPSEGFDVLIESEEGIDYLMHCRPDLDLHMLLYSGVTVAELEQLKLAHPRSFSRGLTPEGMMAQKISCILKNVDDYINEAWKRNVFGEPMCEREAV